MIMQVNLVQSSWLGGSRSSRDKAHQNTRVVVYEKHPACALLRRWTPAAHHPSVNEEWRLLIDELMRLLTRCGVRAAPEVHKRSFITSSLPRPHLHLFVTPIPTLSLTSIGEARRLKIIDVFVQPLSTAPAPPAYLWRNCEILYYNKRAGGKYRTFSCLFK